MPLKRLKRKFYGISGDWMIIIHLLVFVAMLSTSDSYGTPESNTSSEDAQDFSTCINWNQTPESTVGNCTHHGRLLRCYGGINNLQDQKVRKLEEIILCGWPNRDFDPSKDLQAFPRIRALIIEYSSLTAIQKDFPAMQQLQSINISWTNLSYVSTRTFSSIYKLKILDLRWNQLVQLGSLVLPRNFEQLYLSGNPWNCTYNFNWLASEKGQKVADREDINCTDREFRDQRMMLVTHYKVTLKGACQSHVDLRNCTCLVHHMIPKKQTPSFNVNCSNLQFHRLPDYLPENTTISDVSPLRNNPHYRNVADLNLDDNLIESIDVLEGSYWLENFRMLSLRGNRLSKIPIYALDNSFEDNVNINMLLLSRNPWFCTCQFAMRFRELLLKYTYFFTDALNVTCTYKPNNEENEFRRINVVAVTRQDVCKPKEQTKIYYLDILNGVFAFLIVIILSKLAYDYYHYKYYGRVPWIVMKLP